MALPSAVRVVVLGAVAVVVGDHLCTPSAPTGRTVLSALTLYMPTALKAAQLADLAWAGPSRESTAAVHIAVHRLRRWLATTTRGTATIATGPSGYRLDLADGTTDLAYFRDLVRSAPDGAAGYPNLTKAIGLWPGEALQDVALGRADAAIRAELALERTAAVRRCAAAALSADRPGHALALARPLCAADPLDEEAHAIAIEALGLGGLPAAALSEFDRIRRRLSEELGVGPGTRLEYALRQVLRRSATADSAGPHRWRGPRPHIKTIGRDADVRSLAAAVSGNRVVTVTGPGGVGKTVVALETADLAAAGFPDGVVVVPLAGATDQASAMRAWVHALGVSGAAPADVVEHTERALSGRSTLLVVDNCEHVLAAVVPLIAWLVADVPEVTILATSRRPLGISGEVVRPLSTFDVCSPDDPANPATMLFLQRAGEAVPGFSCPPADLRHVREICRRLDGLPLAIELAASRLRTYDLPTLAAHLRRDLRLLSVGGSPAGQRQATLDDLITWSHRLLQPPEALLLHRLSAFRGGFDLEAALAVCADDRLTANNLPGYLVALVDHSLVQPYETAGRRRYKILEAMRAYAAERSTENGEAGKVRERHLAYWLAVGRRHVRLTSSADLQNLRAAIAYARSTGRPEAVRALRTLTAGHCWDIAG